MKINCDVFTPTMKRPRIRTGMDGATPMIIAPRVKRTSEIKIVGFLP
jgi:hypothetical protein